MAQQVRVVLSAAEREQLAAIAADRNRSRKHAERARIVLASADRHSAQQVAQSIGVSRRWQLRFAESGVDGLLRDKTRKPGKAPIAAETTARVVALTCTAAAPGAPLDRTGNGQSPLAFRWVRCSAYEKSQIQALERTEPGLPIKPGRCQTMTHDYKRHGTTTLFAALNVLDGTVIGRCMQRERHLEFIRFLNAVERQVAADRPIHVRPRQLCHPQTSQSAGLAGAASALDLPLQPDLGLLAQRRRRTFPQR
jgi:hypothetical protein